MNHRTIVKSGTDFRQLSKITLVINSENKVINSPAPQPFNTKFIIGPKKDMEESDSKKEMVTPYQTGLE